LISYPPNKLIGACLIEVTLYDVTRQSLAIFGKGPINDRIEISCAVANDVPYSFENSVLSKFLSMRHGI